MPEKLTKNNIKDYLIINSLRGGNENSAFNEYRKQAEIGKHLLKGLLEQRIEDNSDREDRVDRNGNKLKHFYRDGRNKQTYGFLSDIYGCTGVVTLSKRYGVKIDEKTKTEILDLIERYILVEIDKYGYNLFPYIEASWNDIFFMDGFDYTGAKTWALSLFATLVSNENWILNDDLQEKFIIEIKKIVKSFNQEYIENEKLPGWNFTKECDIPSLYFTYSVLEAFSDFEDNMEIAGYSDEEIRTSDRKFCRIPSLMDDQEFIEDVVEFKHKTRKAAMCSWKVFGNTVRHNFIDDNYVAEDIHPVGKQEIIRSKSSNALFNNLYLVFMWIYGYVNVETSGEEQENVIDTMGLALQNVQSMYSELEKEGNKDIVDAYIISFKANVNRPGYEKKYREKLNPEMIWDATILPLLVKANNNLANYITKFPVREMGKQFIQLFENMAVLDERDPDSELAMVWDHNKYDVKNTERYIEAVADFYVYYNAYERNYIKAAINAEQIALELEEKAQKQIATERAFIEEAMTRQKEEAINQNKEEFARDLEERTSRFNSDLEKDNFEKRNEAIIAGLKNGLETTLGVVIEQIAFRKISEMFEHIIKFNEGLKEVDPVDLVPSDDGMYFVDKRKIGDGPKNASYELTSNEVALLSMLPRLFGSYFSSVNMQFKESTDLTLAYKIGTIFYEFVKPLDEADNFSLDKFIQIIKENIKDDMEAE